MNNDLTKIKIFKNTPLTNFQNTILFDSNEDRDNFFLNGNHYTSYDFQDRPFNYIRDRSSIDLPLNPDWARGVNYATFVSDLEPNTRYYAYVVAVEYINDNTTRLHLLIDGVMTFCQGSILNQQSNLKVQRQHLTQYFYNQHLWDIKNNDDILKTHTKSYFKEVLHQFEDFYIVFQSTVDLSVNFGNVDNPLVETSEGGTFDNITSPVNLYAVEHDKFRELMNKLSKFPWITQNFKHILMIPSDFLNNTAFNDVVTQSITFTGLKKLRDNGKSIKFDNVDNMNFSMEDLYNIFELEEDEKHLLRNEYTTSELYTFNGQQLAIDNGKLNPNTGLKISSTGVVGYHNELAFFPLHYRINPRNLDGGYSGKSGAFLNDSITINNFDEIPILIDSYDLALAKNANQRQLTESKLITNRLANFFDPTASLKERFFDSASILSNLTPMNLANRFVDEYEFYREQQAQQADLALDVGTVTQQSTNNGLALANEFYGLTLKFSKPDDVEMRRIKKYYKMFGYYIPEDNYGLYDVRSMSIANYVQFGGDWNINNVDTSIMEQIRIIFESGVRLWHNNNTANPMNQDLINNKMVM